MDDFFFFFFLMRNIESTLNITEPLTTQFAGVNVSNFQPGNFTGWGGEGVKMPARLSTGCVARLD